MDKTKILFVCLGNICRSPSAEGVMKAFVAKRNLEDYFEIDSAGTVANHVGEKADSRSRKHAANRGYDLTSISRKIKYPDDFEYFDLIIGMDNNNVADLKRMSTTEKHKNKIKLMTDYCTSINADSVPDPYYGGADGFELVIDILEDACNGLLNELLKK
ncbi:MAG: low molecular weight phosphotyrosine protein phosphatase [Bacteroidales bacterium]|nr:low molecular weight phosphotyrosine protein phosphatase [Bacteroidales bacterium]